MKLEEGFIHFSIGFDLKCESKMVTDKDGNEIETDFSVVENYIRELFFRNGITFSQHRTQGFVHITPTKTILEVELFDSVDWESEFEEKKYDFEVGVPLTI
jgi:sugar lactone lactonase YvrE